MPIKTVSRNINFSADKPFGVRQLPIENRLPWLCPDELLCEISPKAFWVFFGLIAKALVFRLAFDDCLAGEFFFRFKDPLFSEYRRNGF